MSQEYTSAEVLKHKTRDDCWIIIEDKVYNVTAFLEEHPGGEELILDYAGKDATDMFLDVSHSYTAYKLLKTLLVGTLAD